MYFARAIVAGDHKFVFLVKGHLILVAISYAKESEAQVIDLKFDIKAVRYCIPPREKSIGADSKLNIPWVHI